MATIANPTTVVAVHETGTDFTNAHDTDPSAISPTTVNDLAAAAKPVVNPVEIADGGSMAATVTNLKKVIVFTTPSVNPRSVALPSASDLVSGLDLSANNMSFRFIVRNLTASTHGLTLTCSGGTFLTTGGSAATIAAATTNEFLVRRTGASAVEITRL